MNRAEIETLFLHLGNNTPKEFFEKVSDTVHWTVYGKHPLAGVYQSKQAFQSATTERLSALLKDNTLPLKLTNLWVDGDTAIAEMTVDWPTKKGKQFLNHYCWVCTFEDDQIVKVRAYMDSVAINEVIDGA